VVVEASPNSPNRCRTISSVVPGRFAALLAGDAVGCTVRRL
jgi:hypothetical protein